LHGERGGGGNKHPSRKGYSTSTFQKSSGKDKGGGGEEQDREWGGEISAGKGKADVATIIAAQGRGEARALIKSSGRKIFSGRSHKGAPSTNEREEKKKWGKIARNKKGEKLATEKKTIQSHLGKGKPISENAKKGPPPRGQNFSRTKEGKKNSLPKVSRISRQHPHHLKKGKRSPPSGKYY